jgi:4-amino-4-deoxy-L-arabinose transferase-like glycosyltransferase
VAVYLVIGAQYAVLTPPWQTPDEPAHYNVIRQIAETGRLPLLEPGDYDQAYLERLTREHFPPGLAIDALEYQDYQPPLYYLLATPVYLAAGGALTALRFFSLTLGAGVILLAYLAARELAGPASPVPVIAAAFIAFIPQHIAMLAGVNNDSLSELVIALGLWLVARQSRLGLRPWVLGLVLGAAFLTKVQAYVLAPVFAALLLLRWRRERPGDWPGLLRDGLVIFGLGLAVGSLYWGRNWAVCGPLDFLCGNWHAQVVVGQPRTSEWLAQYGAAEVAQRFAQTTFQSFWGQFGWMGVLMDGRVYGLLLVFSAALLIGAVGATRGWPGLAAAQQEGVLLLALSAALSTALYLYYNLEFVQHQGRYLFPALVPLGIAAAAALRQWSRWLVRALPTVRITGLAEAGLLVLPLAGMAALALLALYRFVLPQLG